MRDVVKQTTLWLLIVIVVAMSSMVYAACSPVPVGHAEHATKLRSVMNTKRHVDAGQASEARQPWNAVRSWAYWLDNPDLQQLGASNVDLLVIDYSANGSAARVFTRKQIDQLRQTNPQRRVVAYLSIGQAESYRGYWQKSWRPGSPDWLGAEDPHWKGNYWVRYWDPAWQGVIYPYLDAIIAAGFDGIYLDRIDAYEENYAAGHEDDMVRFVADLALYAHAHSPLGEDFGIIVQNAEELAADHPDYVHLVTGIAREEVYIRATNLPTSPATRTRVEGYLDLFQQGSHGRLVLTVDYATKADLICEALQRARTRGYVPYATQASLDRLPDSPDCS